MPTDEEDSKPLRIHIESEENPELKIHYKGKEGPIRKIEQDLIDTLTLIKVLEKKPDKNYNEQKGIQTHKENFRDLRHEYTSEPFGNSSEAFLNTPIIKEYLSELHLHKNKKYWFAGDQYFGHSTGLWTLIEHYTLETSKIKKANYFERIKKELIEIHKEIYAPSGQGLFIHINKYFIKNVYLSNDPKLIHLFMTNPLTKLPIPGIEVFEEGAIPLVIQKRESEIRTGINNLSSTKFKK